jgi:hypothetical protein
MFPTNEPMINLYISIFVRVRHKIAIFGCVNIDPFLNYTYFMRESDSISNV